jgi:hypothetical protein
VVAGLYSPGKPLPPERSGASGGRVDFPVSSTNACLSSPDESSDRSWLQGVCLSSDLRWRAERIPRRKLYAICNASLDEGDDTYTIASNISVLALICSNVLWHALSTPNYYARVERLSPQLIKRLGAVLD